MENQIRVAQIMGKMVGGGVESVIMNYYRNIDRNKIQFDFFVDSDSTYIPKDEIEELGGRVIVNPPYQNINKYISELERLFKEGKYKIVHSNINTLSVFPLYAAKKAGVPVRIAHSHSTAGKGEYKKNAMKYCLRPFSKLMPNYFLCCSEYAGIWQFGKKFYDKGNVEIIRNAVNLDKFLYSEDIRNTKRKELNLKDEFVIGHVGRFCYQKNHDFILDIFNEILKKEPNAVLMLVGMGDLESEIKAKAYSLNIEKSVRFMGQREDVNEIMQVFDLFLLPSFYEGLPVVGVEAQAAGLPCVFSDAMTKETKVLESTKFLSLSEGARKWADEIFLFKDFKRKNEREAMTKSGFEIKTAAKKLEALYEKYNNGVVG